MVRKHGLMEHATKENIRMERKMVMADSYGLMAQLTKDNLWITIFMGQVFILGLIKDSIMENG